ncbi:MAG: ABC transporter ATP-binding protein [Bacteroidales bacterium]|nr:ABC transporter ATP-binding protein [Bacteroidales bacterium]
MQSYKKILRYIVPYWTRIALNILFNFLSIVFSLFSLTMVIPFLSILFQTQKDTYELMPMKLNFDVLINNFYYYLNLLIDQHGEMAALVFISLLVVVTSILKNGFKYLALYNLAPVRNGVVMDIRNHIYKKMLQLPLAYYSKGRKGDMISRMSNDVYQVEVSVVSSMAMIFRDPMTIVVYLGWLLIMSPQMTLFVAILLPIAGFVIGRIARSLKPTALKSQGELGVILSVTEETLSGLRVIKSFNAQQKMTNRFFNLNRYYTRLMNKLYRRQDLASPVSEFLGTAVFIIIMFFGGAMVLAGGTNLSPEIFIGYLAIFSQIIQPSKNFSKAWYNIQKGMASAERIDNVLAAEVSIRDSRHAVPKKDFNSDITFKNVRFRYEDALVLKDINLRINKGQKVALVGQSGAGKSTLVDLIPRLYDATEGTISIDGIPINDILIKDLRGLIGNVNQEPILFNDTFFNNIAFGANEVTEEEVILAARIANAHEFISQTPLGYYTNIGDQGGKLSGGQRQRISIARAVLQNPPILILDEATSSLDTESEKLVQEALLNVMENRTSIVIAHRLSTIIHADLICVMHDGQIVETGTHEELLALNGIYKKLHSLQMFS